ncbi:hypothetical protein BN1012_Phect1299 [Candidatus Phaeomarinobacter ectocarpi]|uniref:Uncharacterized protein n=1 Tax=Candidatus Phaeomarinibacter ectocarpi TaxID=1458461 RepID=X5M8A3_9HYPH|nr:hypothetical protein BN1012_Phect1299 [Candidatus Phaeomarinobacter ectocarpi]
MLLGQAFMLTALSPALFGTSPPDISGGGPVFALRPAIRSCRSW